MRSSPHVLAAAFILASTATALDADTDSKIAVGDVYNVFLPSHHEHGHLQKQQRQHPIIGSVIRQDADATEFFIRCDPVAALAAVGLSSSSSAHSHGSGSGEEVDDRGAEEEELEHVPQHHRKHAQAHAHNAQQHAARRSTLDDDGDGNDGDEDHQHQRRHQHQHQAGVTTNRCPIPGPGAYVTMRSAQGVWEYTVDDGAHYSRHEVCSTVSPSFSSSTAVSSPQETSLAETALPESVVVVECTWTEAGLSASPSATSGSHTTTLTPSPSPSPPSTTMRPDDSDLPPFFLPVTITEIPLDPEAIVELKLRQVATGSGANCPASTTSSTARPSGTGTSTPSTGSNGASGTAGSGSGSQPTSPSGAAPGVGGGGGAGALLAAVMCGVAAL